jgi:putative oxidoreductase
MTQKSRSLSSRSMLTACMLRVIEQLERMPYTVLALPLRLAVATVFWNSAMTKLADWNAALELFAEDY